MYKTYFISGIDTDCGKTIVTGLIAKYLHNNGVNVITQKLAQTGCRGLSEDIISHRKIMGIDLFEADKDGTTCPYVLNHPASPHLAAELDHITIDIAKIQNATQKLEKQFDLVLLEGAGGLMVPITRKYQIVDYIVDTNLPLILVTSAKVGSINHTLLSLEMCLQKAIKVHAVVYNHFPNTDKLIINDSKKIFQEYLSYKLPDTLFFEVPRYNSKEDIEVNFEGIA